MVLLTQGGLLCSPWLFGRLVALSIGYLVLTIVRLVKVRRRHVPLTALLRANVLQELGQP